ncbi:MAG: S41 family peptidase [Bacillota bacterium]|nr:S41 family peptidase [Bacillota bacterium]
MSKFIRNKRKLKSFILLVIIITTLSSNMAFSSTDATDETQNSDYLKSIMDMVNDKHKGSVDQNKMMENALKGIFSSMDQYTEFYTKEEANQFFSTIDGEYVGIGIAFNQLDGQYIVEEVYKDSPAEKAGIATGDKIISVDGQSISKKGSQDVVKMISGKKGTDVIMGIIKDGEKNQTKIKVTRDDIRVNPVSYEIRGDIGYIKLSIFNMNAAAEMAKALKELESKKIKKIALDLRDDPGGEVSQVVEIAKNFVPEGLIAKLDFNSEKMQDIEYRSDLKDKKFKLAVLVNGNSASASEILTGAIQDTAAGTIIGTKTFGKAKVQSIYSILTPEAYKKYEDQLGVKLVIGDDLEDKYKITPEDSEIIGWVKITTGYYYTPNGRMIDLKGITPDINVSDGKDAINGVNLSSINKLKVKIKPKLNSQSYEVYSAKNILRVCGYNVDAGNDKFDAKTFDALKKFQKKSGLYPCGNLDFSTQKALNKSLDSVVINTDKQYLKAVEVLN